MSRVLVLCPLPQASPQTPHGPQFDTRQCTGQGALMHASVCTSAMSLHNGADGFDAVRVLDCVPEAHEALQVDHAPHEPRSHSSRQGSVLQLACSIMTEQGIPPYAAD